MPMDPVIVTAAAPLSNYAPTIGRGADWGPIPLGNFQLDGETYALSGVASAELTIVDPATRRVLTTGAVQLTRADDERTTALTLSLSAEQTARILPSSAQQARLVVLLVDDDGHRYPFIHAPITPIDAPATP